jgi:hypothetical protein
VTVGFPDEPERPDLRGVEAAVEAALQAMAPMRAQVDRIRPVIAEVVERVRLPDLRLQEVYAAASAARAAIAAHTELVESPGFRQAVEAATRAAEIAYRARRTEVTGIAKADLGGLTATAKAQIADDAELIVGVARRDGATAHDFDRAIRWLGDQIGELNRQVASLSGQVGQTKPSVWERRLLLLATYIGILGGIAGMLSLVRDVAHDGWTGDQQAPSTSQTAPVVDPAQHQETSDAQEHFEAILRERLRKLDEEAQDDDEGERSPCAPPSDT